MQGQLYVIDKISGQYRWHHSFDSTGVFTPVISNGCVYVVNWKANALWGFDLNTGEDVFFDNSESYLKQPIIADGRLFAGARGKIVSFENFGTGILPDRPASPEFPELIQNWPNPFRTSTHFEIFLPHSDHLIITVYDLSGKEVKILAEKEFQAGIHVLSWDGTNDSSQKVPPGIYILKLSARKYIESRRMILLR
jgi:outer membrane protein assembly factor BamB